MDDAVLAGANEEKDEDEWDGVMELLQASSESHSDDEESWKNLKEEVLERYQQHLTQERDRKAKEDAQRQEEAKNAFYIVDQDGYVACFGKIDFSFHAHSLLILVDPC